MTTKPHVLLGSKPQHVDALATTWRGTAEHKAVQAWRFVRLYAFTFVGQVIVQIVATAMAGGVDITHLDQKALTALVIPAAEVVWRQRHPALTAGAADSAAGVTIVPEQLLPEGDAAP